MNAIILGSRSEIAQGLIPLLERDAWEIGTFHRMESTLPTRWDLIVCCIGKIAPVGLWHKEKDWQEWDECIESNLLLPLRVLRWLWTGHNSGASICFLAGSNPNMIMDGYSAYNVGKMALLKAVEQLDHETPDAKFFALGPGTILTKIHKATLDAKWPNPKLERAMEDNYPTDIKIRKVYDCLKWCISMPKSVVGGRNICVSDMDKYPPQVLQRLLEANPDMYKLRRME